MKTFITDLRQYWKERPFIWSECKDVSLRKVRLPQCGRVLVLGPHPDDPESVAITCRLLMQSGCDIWYAIASLSPSGVEDEYVQRRRNRDPVSLQEKKSKIRQMEQTHSKGHQRVRSQHSTFSSFSIVSSILSTPLCSSMVLLNLLLDWLTAPPSISKYFPILSRPIPLYRWLK